MFSILAITRYTQSIFLIKILITEGEKRHVFYTLIILLFDTIHIVDFDQYMYLKDISLEFPLKIETLLCMGKR